MPDIFTCVAGLGRGERRVKKRAGNFLQFPNVCDDFEVLNY